MKRKILYRAKRTDGDGWVTGNLFVPDEGHDAPTQICMGTNIVQITYDVDPDTVGEYVGINDVNGRAIFEDDIVVFTDEYGKRHVGLVQYNSGGVFIHVGRGGWCEDLYRLRFRSGYVFLDGLERVTALAIIGNIHDSPEFLEADV